MDAYQVLGLPHGATKTKVKAAYRKLANKYHPDRNRAPEAAELFKLIKEAYEFITKGNSSTGAFDRPVKSAPRPYSPPPQPMHPQRVEVWLTFSEAFTGCRAKVRVSNFGGVIYCDVPAGAKHGEMMRLMAADTYGHARWIDAQFHLHDPRGFYTLKSFDGEDHLYCRVKVSLAEVLSERVIDLVNIDPHGGYVPVTVPYSAFTDDKPIKVMGYGMRNRRTGRRAPLYVQPLFYARDLDQESYPTLAKLKDRVDVLVKRWSGLK